MALFLYILFNSSSTTFKSYFKTISFYFFKAASAPSPLVIANTTLLSYYKVLRLLA